MGKYRFELFADYFQFYLQDEDAEGNLSESWTTEAVNNLLTTAQGIIGVGTVRNMTVPVVVEVRKLPPKGDLEQWDQVAECSIEVPSGRIVVDSNGYSPLSPRIEVNPGCYRAQVYYASLDTLSKDGLEGEDHYKIVLWPGGAVEARVIKRRG